VLKLQIRCVPIVKIVKTLCFRKVNMGVIKIRFVLSLYYYVAVVVAVVSS